MSVQLKRAAFDGDIESVRRLVDDGADVNATDEYGSGTLLTFHPDVISYLLSKGADPNLQTNENGSSVLAGLAFVNELECIRILLEHGADPNRGREETLETPLHHVLAGAGENSSEVVRELIHHGADVNARTRPGIISYNFWRDARTRGETPLHRAAAFATVETVALLLHAGADRTIRDVNDDSPMSWASWYRRPKEMIDLLT